MSWHVVAISFAILHVFVVDMLLLIPFETICHSSETAFDSLSYVCHHSLRTGSASSARTQGADLEEVATE